MQTSARPRRIFYGWYIVAASCIMLFFNAGARYAIGVMFKPMLAEFGWSRAALSLAVFLNMLVFALAITVVGRVYDRYGPRWVILVSTVVLAAGYMLTATITSWWQLLVWYGGLAALGLAGTSVPLVAALASKWFVSWRGFAVSVALAGSCLGQFALVPLFTLVSTQSGWRVTYLAIGGIMLVVNVILALTVIKGDPHQLGLEPYGAGARSPLPDRSPGKIVPASRPDMSLRQAIRTRSYWCFLGVMGICGSGDFFVTTHLIPFVTDQGVAPTTAGNMLAWYGLMSLPGILLAGPASDLVGHKLPITVTFVLRIVVFGLIWQYKTVPMFYVFALVFGLTHLVTAPLTPTLIGKLYGFRSLGALTGPVNTVHHLAGGLWAYLGGVIFDWSGSYQLAFGISVVTSCLAVLAMLLVKEVPHGGAVTSRET